MFDAVIAANRFGLGAHPGEIAKITRDPRGFLDNQLRRPDPIDEPGLVSGAEGLNQFFALQQERKAEKQAGQAPEQGQYKPLIEIYRREVLGRLRAAVLSEASFQERLVRFWANHFTVSVQNKIVVAPVAGAYVREAIRPHIMGSFRDLLRAAEMHPAMLLYLDNAQSVGPNSFAGQRLDKGLNENLAREILELHTLGVDGGYTQSDVTSFAKVLTGWTVPRREGRMQGTPGEFHFEPRIHEPGAQVVLGKRYGEDGMAQGEHVLRDLAAHPATHRHLATKLVRHFIADDPPKDSVARIASVLERKDGDLTAVYRALIAEDAAWAQPLAKVKTPEEFLVSILRGLNLRELEQYKLVEALSVLGERPFFANSPQGWPDDAGSWAGPDAIKTRLEYASQVANRAGAYVDARQLAPEMLGDIVSQRTKDAVARAASPEQGLTLLLMSPEFQRR
jgi:uncharacterized protein (DUF1800 family)